MFELRTQWRGFDAAGAAVELPRGVGPMWARLIAGTGAGLYRYVGKFPLGGDLGEVQQILPAVPGLGPDDIRNFVLHVDAASQYPTFAGVLAGDPLDEYRPGFEDPAEESIWGTENAARLRPGRFVPLGQLKEVLWVSCPASASCFERPSSASNRRNSTAKRPDLTLFADDRSRFASVCLQNPGFCRTPDAPVPAVVSILALIRAA